MLSIPTNVLLFKTRLDYFHVFLSAWIRISLDLLLKLWLVEAMLSSFRKQDKKDEESSTSGNPYKNLEKASILQEVIYWILIIFFIKMFGSK